MLMSSSPAPWGDRIGAWQRTAVLQRPGRTVQQWITERRMQQARILLAELLEHATQPRFLYIHEWTLGDLVMWDNRCTLHRGRRYDLGERRELRRSTTADSALN